MVEDQIVRAHQEMERRYALIAKGQVSASGFEPLVVVIDEPGTFSPSPQCRKMVASIGRKGRRVCVQVRLRIDWLGVGPPRDFTEREQDDWYAAQDDWYAAQSGDL